VVISSIYNKLSVHTSTSDKSKEVCSEANNREVVDAQIEGQLKMMDVSLMTRNISLKDIKRMIYSKLTPNLERSQIDTENEIHKQSESLDYSEELVSTEAIEDSLLNRRKHQKLSYGQLVHVKSLIENSGFTIMQLSERCNISFSLLNQLRHKSWSLLLKGR